MGKLRQFIELTLFKEYEMFASIIPFIVLHYL